MESLKKLNGDSVIDIVTEPHENCPFCGGNLLYITSENNFYELYDLHDGATISIDCPECNLDMYEFSVAERDYDKKRKSLIEKWNRRICSCHKEGENE